MFLSHVEKRMDLHNVTILEVSQQTGLSSRTILRARGPWIAECRLSTLRTLSKALGCRVKDLFSEEEEIKDSLAEG